MEWLINQEPEIAFDSSKLKTQQDWIREGEIVFDSPAFTPFFPVSMVRDPAFYKVTGTPLSKDGTVPFYRYVIRKKGEVKVGGLSCGMCHTRVLPGGIVVKGAQGNFPIGRVDGLFIRSGRLGPPQQVRLRESVMFAAPWLRPDPQQQIDQMSIEEIASANEAAPPGVMARIGTSLFYPVQVPDLFGIKDRRYLDRTGLVHHRSIGDVMRYAALNQGADFLDRYGEFIPQGEGFRKLPDPTGFVFQRYSDEQLYALALYIYSLEPPANPNKFDAQAERGQRIFQREGCQGCHTPPLYTNNKLTPAEGFKVPADHLQKYDILPISVGTDPNLALKTRRGTGYYKVPTLRQLWLRGPIEHNGSVATLEDWFDPRRTMEDYEPTGFRGYGVKTRAVRGHPFGLDLSEADRKSLLAFLRTL